MNPAQSLLLDFDGTLVPIAPTPDAVAVPDTLRALMAAVAKRLTRRVALVSGLSLDQLDAICGRCLWPVT
ncbi:MAG: trehalose-phosphatase, partial [Erythrobacter sp.]